MFRFPLFRTRLIIIVFYALITVGCSNAMTVPTQVGTLNVPSTQYPTIQSAIDAAKLGDTIIVEAGRTYTENLILKYKATGSGYITIQSSALANLPAAGNRVSPADAANMPTIRSANAAGSSVFETQSGATPSHHYKLVGLHILRHNSTTQQTALITLGTSGSNQDTLAKVPHHFVIDRCLIRGTDTGGTRRAFAINARNIEILNSYIDNFHQAGSESHGIWIGANGSQDILIGNNFIEGASINFLVGGEDPSITNFVPSNIVVEHNHLFKRLSWFGAGKAVKNLFELKAARNVIVRNNIFENNWGDAQSGNSILFTVRNQDGGHTAATIENVDFEYNILKNVPEVFNILVTDNIHPSGILNNLRIKNNLLITDATTFGGNGRKLLLGGNTGGAGGAVGVVFDHNTFIGRTAVNNWFVTVDTTNSLVNPTFTNNLLAGADGGTDGHGWVRSDDNNGAAALAQGAVNGIYTFTGNLLQRASGSMPTSNFYETTRANIRFNDYAGGNYALRNDSPYKNAGTDGKDIGADITGLKNRTACVVSGKRSDCSTSSSSGVLHDYDGDGRADISLFRPGSGVWHLNRSTEGISSIRFGLSNDILTPADFDGDGKTDIAVFRPSDRHWYILNSSTQTMTIRPFGLAGDQPVAADYDGDGRADIAVWRPSDGFWYRLNSSNGNYVMTKFGMLGDKPVTGDFDGDGQTDLAVFRPSTGVWYLQRSTAGFYAVMFGIATDKPVPADYTGDRITDIAVYRPSNGTWYRFDQASGQTRVEQFGVGSDIPAPADYDGDGQADLAVYRPETGVWYINKSTAGFLAMQFGLNGDIPTVSALFH